MRLLIVMADLRVGGSQVAGVELARALGELGHEVQLAACGGVDDDRVRTAGLDVTVLPPTSSAGRVRNIRGVIDAFAPDVVLTVEAATVLTTLAAARWSRVPTVAYILGPRIPWYIPDALPVFVAMPSLMAFSAQWRADSTRLLPPPVPSRPPAEIRPSLEGNPAVERPEGGLRILAVGRLIEQYKGSGLVTLIRSVEFLPGARLDIVGDGPFRSALEAEAKRVNQSLGVDAISFFGTDPHPYRRFADASVVVGGGMTVIEAATSGVPCVVIGRAGFAAPVTNDTLDELVASTFFGAHGSFDDPKQLADLLTSTVAAGVDPGLSASLDAIYAPRSIAGRLLDNLNDLALTVIPLRSLAMAAADKAHYRLRRRVILQTQRRRISDVDALENEVNRIIRDYPLKRRRFDAKSRL